ncbi:hypothetical protein L218DRAFT_965932 [Marasmius fiardii PR-910]|nr:hypothetical protein L218DRAFT_965932 [Marasmius fiardii PR-910]
MTFMPTARYVFHLFTHSVQMDQRPRFFYDESDTTFNKPLASPPFESDGTNSWT